MTERVLLVGAGEIASVYADVLRCLSVQFDACCVSADSARRFGEKHAVQCYAGGLEQLCHSGGGAGYSHAIVALPVSGLSKAAELLLSHGVENVLVEKPAGMDAKEVCTLVERVGAEKAEKHCFVAYNRRFYASVMAAERAIAEDGGVTSFSFDFTELSDRLRLGGIDAVLLEKWEYANSTHVIDTAFFLAGTPARMSCIKAGSLDIHPDAARYAGVGETINKVPFTYTADWDAPGRWGIEINTRKRKLVLRPVEQLSVQHRNSFAMEPMALADDSDERFKPGYFRQVQAFVTGADRHRLLSLAGQATQLALFSKTIFQGGGL